MTRELFRAAEAVIYKNGEVYAVFIKGRKLKFMNNTFHALVCHKYISSECCRLYSDDSGVVEMEVDVGGFRLSRELRYSNFEAYSVAEALKEGYVTKASLREFQDAYV
jgi:hypothetical protein